MSTSVEYEILLKNGQFTKAAKESERAIRNVGGAVDGIIKEGGNIDTMLKKVGTAAAGLFTIKSAVNFAKQIASVREEVQALEISFSTLLGSSERSAKLLNELKEFAVSTPLQLNDLAKSAQTLLSFNVEAEKIMPTLKAIGDISMGAADKLQSLTLAFSQMSSTGKLMGQDLLQMINAGFNPLTEISRQTGKSVSELKEEMSKGAISAQMVSDAFISATSEGGKFYNMLAQQSNSLQGAFSNLQGALQDMMNGIGESIQEPLTNTIGSLTKLVQNYEKFGGVLASTVVTFGVYKASCMALAAAEGVATALKGGHTIATLALEKAQALLNKTMLANPYVALASATAALVTGIIAYARRTRDARTEQQKLNDMLSESADIKQELKSKTDELIATVADEGRSDLERYQAYKELQLLYPEYLKNLSQEVFLRDKLSGFKQEAPNIIDRNELADMEMNVKLLERYVELSGQRAGLQQQKRNSYRNGDTDADRERTGRQLAEVQREMDSINEKFGGSVVKAAKDAGYRTIDEYSKAFRQAAAQRKSEMEKVAFEKLTIEQKIAVTENSIALTKMKISNIKRDVEKEPFNLYLKLDLKQAEDQLDELESRVESLKSTAGKSTGFSLKAITEEIRKQNRALAAARKSGDATAAENAKKLLDDAKKNYELFTGKNYDSVIKDAKDRKEEQKKLNKDLAKVEEEYSRTIVKQARDAAVKREQARIDGMEEGKEKRLAQIDLDYQKEKNTIDEYEQQLTDELAKREEARWKAANSDLVKKGDVFDFSSVTSDMLSQEQKEAIAAMRNAAAAARDRAVNEAEQTRQDILAEYENLQTKIEAIRKKYDKLRKEAAGNDVATANINKSQSSEIANLIMSTFKADEAIGKMAESISSLGKAARGAIADKLYKILQFAQNSRIKMVDAQSVKEFAELNGVSEELLNSLINNDAALKEFDKYVSDIGKQAKQIDTLKDAVDNYRKALDKAKSGKILDIDALEQANGLLNDMIKALADNILDELNTIGDVMTQLGDLLGDDNMTTAGEFLNDFTSNIQAAEEGAQAWGGWWGAIIGGVTDLIPKIVKWATGTRDLDREIKRLDESLQRISYDLSMIDRYTRNGTTIDQFREKWRLLAASAEEAGAKMNQALWKNDGDQQAEEYQQALYDYRNYLEQLSEYLEEYFGYLSGSSVSGLFEDMSDMIWDTFESGEDAMDDFEQHFSQVLLNMIKKQVLWEVMGDKIEQYIRDLSYHFAEGHLTGEDAMSYINWLRDYGSGIAKEGRDALEALRPIFEGLSVAVDDASTLSGSIKGITAEQAGMLAGQMNAMRTAQLQQVSLLTEQLDALNNIGNNTRYIREIYNYIRSGNAGGNLNRAYGQS